MASQPHASAAGRVPSPEPRRRTPKVSDSTRDEVRENVATSRALGRMAREGRARLRKIRF